MVSYNRILKAGNDGCDASLGGGLSNAGKLLTKEVNARLPEKCYAGKFLKPCEVRIAALKNDAGIYGAAALIHLSLSEEVRRT